MLKYVKLLRNFVNLHRPEIQAEYRGDKPVRMSYGPTAFRLIEWTTSLRFLINEFLFDEEFEKKNIEEIPFLFFLYTRSDIFLKIFSFCLSQSSSEFKVHAFNASCVYI